MGGVSKRLVIYFSGFDPRGARHYHLLYRREAMRQAQVTGQQLEVGPRSRVGEHLVGWEVRSANTVTDYRVFEWDDIVRRHWPRRALAIGWTTLRSGWQAFRSGALGKTRQWSWPAFVTATMPPLALLLTLFLALGLAAIGYASSGGLGLALGALAGMALLLLAAWAERKFNIAWISRVVNFHLVDAAGGASLLHERLDACASSLDLEGHDEVLVVGHSYGTSLAVLFTARLLERGPTPPLSLLTLGQTIPWLAWLPQARGIRHALRLVGHSNRVDWLDVSAPPDGACFALVDPLTAIGEELGERSNPKLLNARFHESMAGTAYAKSTRDWMQLHFQYVMATAHPAQYDYFAITAGDRTLASRFADRQSVRDFTRLRGSATKAIR